MAINNDKVIEILAAQMMTIANDTTSKANYTKEYLGIVEQIISAKKYKIRYNNASHEISTKNNLGLKTSDTVHVIVPNNNVKNRYILEDLIKSFAIEISSGGDGTGTITGGVTSVDGFTGSVILSGIYAKKSNVYTKSEINTMLGDLLIPTNMSELTDDVGYVKETELEEKMKITSAYHEHSNKTILDNTTASFTTTEKDKIKKLGSAAYTESSAYDVSGSATTAVSSHNIATDTHNDIRLLIAELKTQLTNFLDVDDTTTDQLSEVITLIENNKGTLESLTTSKINVSDIINNLTTNVSTKVLSASQGVVIKALIDKLEDSVNNLTYNMSNKLEGDGYVTGIMNDGGDYALTTIGGDILLATKDDIQDIKDSNTNNSGETIVVGSDDGVPDYAAIVDEYIYTTVNSAFEIPDDGYIQGGTRHDTNHAMFIQINGVTVAYNILMGDATVVHTTSLFPVKKGDIVLFHNLGASLYETWVRFFPIRKDDTTHILNPNEDGYKLLWENPDITATFKSQTIQTGVDLSDYDYVKVYSMRSTSAPFINPMTEIPINQTGLMYGSPSTKGGADAYRTATVNANGNISFSTGITGSSESNNDMIPYQIYGIKDKGGVTISKKDVYSTEEQKIGTWVDGKPLYRRYYTGTYNFPSGGSLIVDTSFTPDLYSVKKYDGVYHRTDGDYIMGSMYTQICNNSNGLYLNASLNFLSGTYELIVEYTKTTD